MNIRRLFLKAKDVTISDYLSVFPMVVGLFLSLFYKDKYKDVWAICERKTEARDNGYHFFKYMRTHCPEQRCIYAIDKTCKDYSKVGGLGEIVQFGSVKHWILYFTCKYLISSQSFKPNGYVCTFFERLGVFKPVHVFLQHGITVNKPEYLLSEQFGVKFFFAGAKPEFDFIKKELGYPSGTIQYTGFSRFDNLHDFKCVNNRILIMPTWRKWLRFKSEVHDDLKMDIGTSEYIFAWKELLNSERLSKLIDKYNLEVIFYPHPNFKGILNLDGLFSDKIKVADIDSEDIQELLKSSKLLITDYSSVAFDMIYMKKPVIFFQFDLDKFRKYHYPQGWFDYQNSKLARAHDKATDVVSEIETLVKSQYVVTDVFLKEHAKTFPLYDTKNSQRIFEFLIKN